VHEIQTKERKQMYLKLLLCHYLHVKIMGVSLERYDVYIVFSFVSGYHFS